MSSRDPQDRTSIISSGSTLKRDSGASAKGKEGADPCDLFIDVDLEGVRKPALAGLKVGDRLSVRLEVQSGLQAAVCVAKGGEVVGALSAFQGVAALINCLNKNQKYVVNVTAIGKASCHVNGGRVSK